MTVQPVTDTVTVTIDGYELSVPKGTLVIRAAEMIGKKARPRSGQGTVDTRQEAAAPLAAERRHQFEVAAGGGVAAHRAASN